MQFSWPIFLLIMGLGILQLAVGVIFGRALPLTKDNSEESYPLDSGRLRKFANRLSGLVASVADDVGDHQLRIEQVSKSLTDADPGRVGSSGEAGLDGVARIIQINERLQTRLGDAEEKLQRQTQQIESHITEARTDPLTGLYNRRAFDDELLRRIAEWRRKQTTFCMMMIDVDHFKRLNDRYGHPAGDHVLRNLAELLASTFREMDLVARVGGEEFAAVLPGTELCDARMAAERVRYTVASHPFFFENQELRITISLGVATAEPGDDIVSLTKRTDEALYNSKRSGRNCGHYHDGRICKLITVVQPGKANHAEMQATCNELRQRLAEVTEESE